MLKFLLGVVLALSLVSPARADHGFGIGAGWPKAKAGRSIRVWSPRRLGVDLGAVVRPWNTMAGWKLLRPARRRGHADVLILPGSSTWVQCSPSYTDAYEGCVVWTASSHTETLQHELGHTLGLADHIVLSMDDGRHVNPRVCDEELDERFSPYRGVMSYCSWNSGYAGWFGEADHRMLAEAGYPVAG